MATEFKPNNEIKLFLGHLEDRLNSYYRGFGKTYYNNNGIGLLYLYVDKNGFDVDDVKDDLQGNPHDSILIDFDEKFPFSTPPSNRNEAIHQLLNKFFFKRFHCMVIYHICIIFVSYLSHICIIIIYYQQHHKQLMHHFFMLKKKN